MIKNKTLRSIFEVTASNITTIIAGIVVGFIIPKILSLEDYGYYKTFTLYTTYIGLFSLGIADGIVLKYGGKDYEELDKKTFRSYFKWYLLVIALFVIVMFIIGGVLLHNDAQFLLIALGVEIIGANGVGYFQQISQITQRFKEFSMRKILQSVCNIVVVGILFLLYHFRGEVHYQIYITFLLIVNTMLTLWYLLTYKDIVFGESKSLGETKSEILSLIKNGFPLLWANLCSTLIFSLDRLFVNILFDNLTYAVYAFAYSMLSLVTVATSAIGTVLYPKLKRTKNETLKDNYPLFSSVILIFVFAAMAVYFPLEMFINWYLPNYTGSLIIFRVVFPGLSISSLITVIIHNYYKVLGVNFLYFKKSIVVLIISTVTNAIAYAIFKTTISISAASILTMIIWYLYVEQYLVKLFNVKRRENLIYMVIMTLGFYVISAINKNIIGFFLYVVLFTLVTIIIKKRFLLSLKKLL
ncbi:MAG: oligosaccharide flippase family protein [Velocimicrobium sp.]